MTKKSRFFLSVIILCVAVVAVHRMRLYMAQFNPPQETQNIISAAIVPPAESTLFLSIPAGQNDFPDGPYESAVIKNLMQGEMLSAQAEAAAAAETNDLARRAREAFAKYADADIALKMAEEFKNAGFEGIDFVSLNGPGFFNMSRDPALMAIVEKYMKDKQFIKLMQTAASDPQVRAVAEEIQARANTL